MIILVCLNICYYVYVMIKLINVFIIKKYVIIKERRESDCKELGREVESSKFRFLG